MKLLHFADLHLEARFAWARPDVARHLRNGIAETLERIFALADAESVDAILCGGDLYEDECVSNDTIKTVEKALNGAGRPVVVSPGNHDPYRHDSVYARGRWSSDVHIFTSPRLEPLDLGAVTLWGAAHTHSRGTAGFLNGFSVADAPGLPETTGLDVGLFHGAESTSWTFQGEDKDRHAEFDRTSIDHAGLAHVFCGHYHRSEVTPRLTYPGNPTPLSFGESPGRGVAIAEIGPDGVVDSRIVNVSSRVFLDQTIDVSGFETKAEVLSATRAVFSGASADVGRLQVCGELGTDISVTATELGDEARRGSPELRQCIVTWAIKSPLDVEGLAADTTTVAGQFINMVRSRQLDTDQTDRVIEIGLRALAGHDLEAHYGVDDHEV